MIIVILFHIPQRSVCTIVFKGGKVLLSYYSQGNWVIKRLNKCCSRLSMKSVQSFKQRRNSLDRSLRWAPSLSTPTAEPLPGLFISLAASCPQTSGVRSSRCGWEEWGSRCLQGSSMLGPCNALEFINMLRPFWALESLVLVVSPGPTYAFVVCCLHWHHRALENQHDTTATR